MTVDDYEYKWIVIDRDNQWAAGEGHQSHNFVQAVHSAKKEVLMLHIQMMHLNCGTCCTSMTYRIQKQELV